MPGIGYVTSGNLTSGTFNDGVEATTFFDKFKAGLATVPNSDGNLWNPGVNVEIKTEVADGDYDADDTRQALNRGVKKLSRDRDVELIVAVGGLVTAFAARRHSEKPFLVIAGQLPVATEDGFALPDLSADPPTFCGGIVLNSPAVNLVRNQRVVARLRAGSANAVPPIPAQGNADAKDVCLIFNKNARMAKAERRIWTRHGWPALAGGYDVDGDNDEEDFVRVLKKAKKKKKAKGIVVSADPFFQHQQQKFTAAANDADYDSIVFCYPSKYFRGKANRDIWYGPDLWAEYRKLGIMAGRLLTEITRPDGGPNFMGLDVAVSTGGDF